MGSPQPGLQEEKETEDKERGKLMHTQKVKQIVKQNKKGKSGPGRIRTYDQSVMSRPLCR